MSAAFPKGSMFKPVAVKICVLYDPSDGGIKHVHHVVTLPGGKLVDDKEVERRTLERAAARGISTSKLKLLHVQPKGYDPSSHYRVDIKSKRLVKTTVKATSKKK